MWSDLGAAIALVLVLEGLVPFVNPGLYRATMAAVARMQERSVRAVGLISMVAGVILLYWVRG